jgi:signal transduction histidine kinase
MSHPTSVPSIRNRLFLLLFRAFAIALGFLIVFSLLATGIILAYPSQSNPLYRLPILARLEAFYIGHGSWEGASSVFENSLSIESSQWQSSILLDQNNRIVWALGKAVDPASNHTLQPPSQGSTIPIIVHGKVVGTLIMEQNTPPPERRFTFGFLTPLLLLSMLLAVFATLIGLLLSRRVVLPLAEVISAAEKIADGNLQTRVQVRAPSDLHDLSESFNKMAESLEKNDLERRDNLAIIAHELRTPLTVMRGRLEGIVDGVYPADESQIGPVLEETYLLERLVDDLRLLTMAESHQLVFEKRELDLVEIIRRSISMFQAEADEMKITLELATSLDKALITADPLRTEQVVGNLISNALRYIQEGGRIWVEVTSSGNRILAAFNDNGPGVHEADLPFLFDRFWRGEKSRSRVSGGVGLGLAIAKLLVEGQGGNISAMNLPKSGLQVEISFTVEGINSHPE